MSEEKPTFKVTDRRLFNNDGSPRDTEREETSTTPESNVVAFDRGEAGANATASSAPAPQTRRESAPREADASPAAKGQSANDAPPEASDPTNFVNLLMFVASPAAASLGLTEHPQTGAPEIDLPLAQHCIDLLATLRQKTAGNLSFEEQQALDGLLSELRMQYVSLAGGMRPATTGGNRGGNTGGGFTGSDITGGR